MGKVRTIYRILVPVLVVLGMALSPFSAMETAKASSVSSAWVELSDGTALNSTSTVLEYVVHFTTTTALEGGAVAVAAAPVEVIVCAPDEVAQDSDFTADVSIGEVADFDGGYYDVTFDAAVLRLDDVTTGLIGSTTIPVETYWEVSPGTWRVVQSIPGATGVTGSGYLAVLHFRVIGSLGDSSDISLSGSLYDTMAEEIPATWVSDAVDVTPALPGDANGDGIINALDITKVERIIVRLDTPTAGADANQDGTINALDITATERTLAGLD